MCVCVCVCVYECVFVECTCVSEGMRVFLHMWIIVADYIFLHVFWIILQHTHTHKHTHTHTNTHTHAHTHTHIYIVKCGSMITITWRNQNQILKTFLRAILNKSWRHHPTKQQLYGHLPSITKTIKIRRSRHVGNCWRSGDKPISDVLLWTPSHGRAKAGRPIWTYIQQLCADTRWSSEEMPKAMDDREGWRERVRDICTDNVTWWWWCW